MRYVLFGDHDIEELGFLPEFLDEDDPRSAREQFNANYVGGWGPMSGFLLDGACLVYPGDPPLRPIGYTTLRDEVVVFYPYAFVMVKQPDGTFEATRMD